jgi:CCCH-type zinc finger/RNA-binding, Nab2-type zinc finger
VLARYSHTIVFLMLPPRGQKPCSFYRTNSCTKGVACSYSHTLTEQAQSPSRIVCRHYSTGTCSFGERCRNIHAKPNEVAVAPSQIPCVFWAAGNCAKGSQCGFSHGALASDAKSWRGQRPSHSALLNFGKSTIRATKSPTESNEEV